MTFSDQEKRKAEEASGAIHIGSIGTFTGSLGGVVHKQSITATHTTNIDLRSHVAKFLDGLDQALEGLPSDETAEVVVAAKAVRDEIAKPEVDEPRIKRALRAVGAANACLANYATQALITAEIGKIITGH